MNPAEIHQWTTRNLLARAAYRTDELARNGICAGCEERPRDGRHHYCTSCRNRKARARRKP